MLSNNRFILLIFLIPIFLCGNCHDKVTNPSLDHLKVEFIEGFIGADLMPVVLPDPIFSHLKIVIENQHSWNTFENLTVKYGYVVLNSTNSILGKIEFNSNWDGILEPSDIDTVELDKVFESEKLFDPPCGQEVYLNIEIHCDCGASKHHETDLLIFGCVY